MANKKFSEFVLKTSTSDVSHIVGYNGAENVQITPANFVTGGGTGVFLPLAGGTMVGNTTVIDNKKIIFGTSGDGLEIFHDSSNSFIKDIGTGDLYIDSSVNFFVRNQANNNVWIQGNSSGVNLRYQGAKKIETTSTGISVTGNGTFAGTVLIDGVNSFSGLEIKGASSNKPSLNFSNANAGILGQIYGSETSSLIFATTPSGTTALTLDASQKATFAGDVLVGNGKFLRFPTAGGTGGNATINYDSSAFTLTCNNSTAPMIFKTSSAEKMRLDASGKLGIGTSSPSRDGLNVFHTTSPYIHLTNTSTGDSSSDGGYVSLVGDELRVGNQESGGDVNLFVDNDSTVGLIIKSGGNVGIGTSSPQQRLQVGDGSFDAVTRNVFIDNSYVDIHGFGIYMSRSNSYIRPVTTNSQNFLIGASGNIWQVLEANAVTHTFKNGTSEKMRLDASGRLGVGTSFPDAKLGIKPALNTNSRAINIYPQNSTAGNYTSIGSQFSEINQFVSSEVRFGNETASGGGSYLGFSTGSSGDGSNSEKMRLTSAGNLGVGGTPNRKIHGFGDLAISNAADTGALLFIPTSSDNYIYSRAGNQSSTAVPLLFMTGNTERMRLTSDGDLLIGVTSIADATSRAYGNAFSGSGAVGNWTSWGNGSHSHAIFRNGTNIVGTITTNTTTTTYNTSSDYRLKEDLQDFEGLDLVSKIPVYDYKWKADESRSYGVMAHELEEVLPQAVSGEKDAEEMQSVDYSKIVPLLVKSIQELSAKLEALECQCEKK